MTTKWKRNKTKHKSSRLNKHCRSYGFIRNKANNEVQPLNVFLGALKLVDLLPAFKELNVNKTEELLDFNRNDLDNLFIKVKKQQRFSGSQQRVLKQAIKTEKIKFSNSIINNIKIGTPTNQVKQSETNNKIVVYTDNTMNPSNNINIDDEKYGNGVVKLTVNNSALGTNINFDPTNLTKPSLLISSTDLTPKTSMLVNVDENETHHGLLFNDLNEYKNYNDNEDGSEISCIKYNNNVLIQKERSSQNFLAEQLSPDLVVQLDNNNNNNNNNNSNNHNNNNNNNNINDSTETAETAETAETNDENKFTLPGYTSEELQLQCHDTLFIKPHVSLTNSHVKQIASMNQEELNELKPRKDSIEFDDELGPLDKNGDPKTWFTKNDLLEYNARVDPSESATEPEYLNSDYESDNKDDSKESNNNDEHNNSNKDDNSDNDDNSDKNDNNDKENHSDNESKKESDIESNKETDND